MVFADWNIDSDNIYDSFITLFDCLKLDIGAVFFLI